MSEVDSSPEKLKIPENWDFPERDNPGFKLVQIDPEERFLALTDPNAKGYNSVQYFFDREGNIAEYLLIPKPLVIATLNDQYMNNIDIGLGSDTKAIYNIGREAPHAPIRVGNVTVFLLSSEDDIRDPELEDMRGGDYLEYKFDVSGSKYNSTKREFDTGNFVLRAISRKKVDVFDKDDKHIFEIEFGAYPADREEHKPASLFVSQKHIPTGIVKTLEVPLRIDHQKIAEALKASPPYSQK